MKKILLLTITLLSFLIVSCEDPSSPKFPLEQNYFKGNGIVEPYGWAIRVGSLDIYHFGSMDNKTPYSEGFKENDHVYFEAEIGWYKVQPSGGTTYWCKLLLIRKR